MASHLLNELVKVYFSPMISSNAAWRVVHMNPSPIYQMADPKDHLSEE